MNIVLSFQKTNTRMHLSTLFRHSSPSPPPAHDPCNGPRIRLRGFDKCSTSGKEVIEVRNLGSSLVPADAPVVGLGCLSAARLGHAAALEGPLHQALRVVVWVQVADPLHGLAVEVHLHDAHKTTAATA